MIYRCQTCKYKTPRQLDYTRHCSSNKHKKRHMICHICDKEYSIDAHYQRHLSKCILEHTKKEQEHAPIPANNSSNNEMNYSNSAVGINNGTVNNNNHDTNNIYVVLPSSFSGNEYKYLTQLISPNVSGLLEQTNVNAFRSNFRKAIDAEVQLLTKISSYEYDQDDYDKIVAKDTDTVNRYKIVRDLINQLHNSGLNIAPSISAKDADDIAVWLNPELIQDTSILTERGIPIEDINQKSVDTYLNNKIIRCIIDTYINTKHNSRKCLFSPDGPIDDARVFYKPEAEQHIKKNYLLRLTKEVLFDLVDTRDELSKLLFSNLNSTLLPNPKINLCISDIEDEISQALDLAINMQTKEAQS